MPSYTQRTLEYLRKEGYVPWMVERWLPIHGIPGGGKRVDAFNLLDIVAYRTHAYGNVTMYGIQSTGPSGHASHRRSMLENEHLPLAARRSNAGLADIMAQAPREARRQAAAMGTPD